MEKIKLIIGLGNPDKKYSDTYHNIGHIAVEQLSEKLKAKSVKLLKTDVYMNLSGSFVAKALKKNRVKPENLLVIHDDSDITVGNFKICFNKGSAGHKGVQSIIDALNTKKFWRVRIGIRQPNEKVRQKAEKFVLKKISSKDKKIFEAVFTEIQKQLTA